MQFQSSLEGTRGTKTVTCVQCCLMSLSELYVLYSTLIDLSSECSSADHSKAGAPQCYRTLPLTLEQGCFQGLLLLITTQFHHGSLRSPNQQRLLLILPGRSTFHASQFFKYLCWELLGLQGALSWEQFLVLEWIVHYVHRLTWCLNIWVLVYICLKH